MPARSHWTPRQFFPGLAIVVLLISWCATAFAQDERATVRLDGRAVFRVSEAPDTTASERARRIERRLNTLLETPEAITPSRIEGVASGLVITVTGVPVVNLTSQDADDNLLSLETLARQWAATLDEALLRARDGRTTAWGRFSSEVKASVQAAFARLIESAIRVIPRILSAALVIVLFWGFAASIRRLMRTIFRRFVADLTVENLIKQFAYYTVWAIGLIVAVDALGFDPQAVATGLGLTGLALGFALKDIISNFVSGILILMLRPFHLGDQIIVGDTEGSVERIELRATEIRTYDGRVVLVPNAELFTSRVTNNTAAPLRRGNVQLYLGYDVDLRKVVERITDAAERASGVLRERPVSVRVKELGKAEIQLDIRFWTDSRRSDYMDTASAVRQQVLAALRDAGIPLPDDRVKLVLAETQR